MREPLFHVYTPSLSRVASVDSAEAMAPLNAAASPASAVPPPAWLPERAEGARGARRFWRRKIVCALAAALLLLLFAPALQQQGARLARQLLPLTDIQISSADDVQRLAAQEMLEELRYSNLLLLDMQEWRKKLQQLPGIEQATLSRRLPHGLHVRLSSSAPAARRQDGSVIDISGRRYSGSAPTAALPLFIGDERRIAEMLAFYRQARALLPGGILQLEVDARGRWKVFTAEGLLLLLGKEPLPRYARYARLAARLAGAQRNLRVIDLRYERGAALQRHKEEA